MHVLGSCEASAQYSPINFFVNLFHSKNSNLPHCFSDLIHTEYRKLHKNNGHPPFFLPPIMRSSVGQCRNIRFRQLYASHVIITSDLHRNLPPHTHTHARTNRCTHAHIHHGRPCRPHSYLSYLSYSFLPLQHFMYPSLHPGCGQHKQPGEGWAEFCPCYIVDNRPNVAFLVHKDMVSAVLGCRPVSS